MKKGKIKHYGNKYYYDENNNIYYQDKNDLNHFLRIVKNFDLYNKLKKHTRIFLDLNNGYKTSFFDYELQGIHLLKRHLEKFTVIHELTHCLQWLVEMCDEEQLELIENGRFLIKKPIVYNLENEYVTKSSSTKVDIREPYTAYCDILNSFALGGYAIKIGAKSHTPRYYKDDASNCILECHSNYNSLLYNDRVDIINMIPQELLDIIEDYNEIIIDRFKKLN